MSDTRKVEVEANPGDWVVAHDGMHWRVGVATQVQDGFVTRIRPVLQEDDVAVPESSPRDVGPREKIDLSRVVEALAVCQTDAFNSRMVPIQLLRRLASED